MTHRHKCCEIDTEMAEVYRAIVRLNEVERLKGQLLIDLVDRVADPEEAKALLTELIVEGGDLIDRITMISVDRETMLKNRRA